MYDHLGGGEMTRVYETIDAARLAERARESSPPATRRSRRWSCPYSEPLDGLRRRRRSAEAMMAAIREAVGDEVDIMVDFHGRTTPAMAHRLCPGAGALPASASSRSPAAGEHRRAGRRWRGRLPKVPIATGERLVDPLPVPRAVRARRHAPSSSPTSATAAACWEARKIAAMAETYYVSASRPHNPLGPIATAAALHFAFATPNFLIQEAIRSRRALARRGGAPRPIRMVDGHWRCRSDPGSGSRSTKSPPPATPSSRRC